MPTSSTAAKLAPPGPDLDLLLYGDLWCGAGRNPHPRDEIVRHAFILRPLAEVAGRPSPSTAGVDLRELCRCSRSIAGNASATGDVVLERFVPV